MTNSVLRAAAIGAALVLLGGCGASRSARPAGGPGVDPLQARGEAPGWRLTVTPERVVYASDDGATLIDEANTSRTVPRAGLIQGQRVRVQTALQPCALAAGTYTQTVRVTVDGVTRSGCGGERSQELAIGAGPWTILAVNGRPTPVDRPFEARFDRSVLTMRLGCDRVSASYVLAGQLLSAGAVTRAATVCADQSFEEAAVRTLSLPLSVEAIGSEQLILRNALGTLSLARTRS